MSKVASSFHVEISCLRICFSNGEESKVSHIQTRQDFNNIHLVTGNEVLRDCKVLMSDQLHRAIIC